MIYSQSKNNLETNLLGLLSHIHNLNQYINYFNLYIYAIYKSRNFTNK